MEFWSKGLGKRRISLELGSGETQLSEEAVCVKGNMDAPVSWEYVMLLDEVDFVDFFALLQEPALAEFVHRSPNRWHLYFGLVKGGILIAWLAIVAALSGKAGEERVTIQLPPASPTKKKKKQKKRILYRRRLSTTTLVAPTMTPASSSGESAEALGPQGA